MHDYLVSPDLVVHLLLEGLVQVVRAADAGAAPLQALNLQKQSILKIKIKNIPVILQAEQMNRPSPNSIESRSSLTIKMLNPASRSFGSCFENYNSSKEKLEIIMDFLFC